MLLSNASVLTTLLLVFLAAIIGGILAMRLRLPLITGYIVAGVLAGTIVSSSIDRSFLTILSDTGITLLLFALGLESSFQRLRQALRFVGWAAVIQIIIVFLTVHVVLLLFAVPFTASLFIATAAALSSSAVAIKILSEQGEQDTVYGESAIAWLVIQDLSVIPIMFLLPALVTATANPNTTYATIISDIAVNMGKAAIIILSVLAFGRRLIPWLLGSVVKLKSREVFVVAIVSVVFLAAGLAVSLGLSPAIGAFLAGLLISETSQNHAVFSEIRPLRDAFSVLFFVSLGILVSGADVLPRLPLIVAVSLIALGLKGGIVFILSRFIGLHRKAAFQLMLILLPMSEFGFIIASEGKKLGALGSNYYVFLVFITFTTILIGSPMILHGRSLYNLFNTIFLVRFPKFFPEKAIAPVELPVPVFENHIVLCGYGRVGRYIGRALEMARIPVIVVDYNHTVLTKAEDRGIIVVNGDPADRDILLKCHLEKARAIIIAIPDRHTQELIIGNARSINRHIHIISRSHWEEDQKYLKALGVDVVIQPEFEAAVSIASRILSNYGLPSDDIAGKISRLKIEHGLG